MLARGTMIRSGACLREVARAASSHWAATSSQLPHRSLSAAKNSPTPLSSRRSAVENLPCGVRHLSSALSGHRASAGRPAPRNSFTAAAKICRSLSTAGTEGISDDELRSRLDQFQDLFVEARLCIEDCADSADTTYFDEEAEAAREAVDEAVRAFETLLGDLDEEERGRVMRQNGLKVEQLKGELEMVLGGGH